MIEIQQPEVHLHPKAQAALGDVFFELAIENSGKRFLVETHSDYIIDRFRQKQKKSGQKPCTHVLFFLRRDGKNHAYSITIDEKGNYDADQPEEFRKLFITEAIENLGL
jgi:predicted ATPase